jgi:SAM-dependent methyltransferase
MEQKDFWARRAREFAGLYEEPTLLNRLFRRALYLRARMTVERIRSTPGATVLDVGSGPGRNSVLFVKEGGASRVVGVDLAEDMVAMARALAEKHGVADRCTFIRGDFLTADLGAERFDYSAALGVMDYIADPAAMLARMRALSRREAIASFPGFAPLRVAQRRVRYALGGCRVYWFWKSEVEGCYRRAGFPGWELLPCTRAGWLAVGKCGPDAVEGEGAKP